MNVFNSNYEKCVPFVNVSFLYFVVSNLAGLKFSRSLCFGAGDREGEGGQGMFLVRHIVTLEMLHHTKILLVVTIIAALAKIP